MKGQRWILWVAFVWSFISAIPPVHAATLRVPQDYPTIQSAINAAQAGDTIQVAAGTYNELLTLKSGITLQGDNRSSIIQGTSASPVILCDNLTQPTLIRGFKITGGQYGVRVMGNVTALTIDNNLVTGNLTNQSGVGIRLESGASATVVDNTIQTSARGIEGLGNNTVTIRGNAIDNCRGAYGGGIYLTGAQSPQIINNRVTNCWDGAINLYQPVNAYVARNRIVGNGAWNQSAGITISLSGNANAKLYNNLIRNNQVSNFGSGAGLNAYGVGGIGGTIELYNNVFAGNNKATGGSDADAVQLSSLNGVAKNNIFYTNGGGNVGILFQSMGTQDFSYNDIWEPNATSPTSGVVLGPGNLQADPLFLNQVDYFLAPPSPCINTGDPNPAFNDLDGTRNDMGIYGGPQAATVAQLPTAYQDKLVQYAKASVRYFTSPQSNDKLAAFPHAFFGEAPVGGWRECDASGNCIFRSWALTRGYGSHVNINEVTLRFLALAVAYQMNWLDYLPSSSRYAESWGQIKTGLETLRLLQTSGDSEKYHQGTFHRAYITTIARDGQYDLDRTPAEITRTGSFEQSSDDNGLPYMNLLILEGLANDPQAPIPDRQAIVDLCRSIRAGINLRHFVVNNAVVHNFVNDIPSSRTWDRLGAEGALILSAMLLSGQISLEEFYQIAPSLQNKTVNWTSHQSGVIPIKQATYHSALFIHGLRSLHGMPVTPAETTGSTYFQESLKPILSSHMDLAFFANLNALGSQAMTQVLRGYPVFEYWSGTTEFSGERRQIQFAGNEQNRMPDPSRITGDGAMARATAPHAWFVPLSRWQQLPQPYIDALFNWMASYESGFFHSGSDSLLGWEAVIPWRPADTQNAWFGANRWNYSDWGRPYEALNNAYSLLHAFDALNPDKPLARYSVEAQRLAAIAAYFDSGTAIPPDLFPPASNQPPVLNPIGNKTVAEGQTLGFTIHATDPEGNTISYSANPLPSGASFITNASPIATPWQSNAYGNQSTNVAWNYAMGYHFTPLVDGKIYSIGGFFNGTKLVKLFNKATGALLASVPVTAANNWAYGTLNPPLPVTGGTTYTVAVYLAGSGGSYRNSLSPALPQTFGSIRIEGSTYASTASDPNARPTNTITSTMYGQADITFVSDKGSFLWKPNFSQAGTYPVTFSASDGQLSDSEAVTITVQDTPVADLIMTALSGPTSSAPGNTIGISNTVKNQGNASAGAFYIGLYLSSDPVITASDTLLGTRYVSSLAAGASSSATTSVQLPSTLTSASYYLGAIADYNNRAVESTETNNALTGNAIAITSSGSPDLVMTAISGPGSAHLSISGSMTLSHTVANQGTGNAGAFYLGFYLSADPTITTSDIRIGTRYISSLTAGTSSISSTSVVVPNTVAPGTYYLGAIADYSNQALESNETNNARVGNTMVITVQADLVMTAISGPASATKGSSVVLSNTAKNQGVGSAGSFYVGLYLSTDSTITTGDTRVGTRWISSLAAGASSSGSSTVTIPSTLPSGTYSLGAIADYSNRRAETNETNNSFRGNTITVN